MRSGESFLSAYRDSRFQKAAYGLKLPKTRDLALLAHQVQKHPCKGGEMNKPQRIRTTVCREYQRLLEDCQSALEIWDERRAEVCGSRLIGRETGDELLRLQAKYARAYAVLQRHSQDCLLCQLVTRMEGSDSENNANALSDSTMY